MRPITFLRLLRAEQWYKNLVIFLPIFFGNRIGNIDGLLLTLLGFAALCMTSSSIYIINDIHDRKQDRQHPQKKARPIAAGQIGIRMAALIAAALLFLGIALASLISLPFFAIVATLAILSQAYTFFLRQEAFADVLVIGINFVLRAVSGAYVITTDWKPYIWVSPWLILCPFFLSMFLSSLKRRQDLQFQGLYSKEMTELLTHMSSTLLVISYALYSFLGVHQRLLYTIPVAIYVVVRYYYLAANSTGNPPHAHLEDKRLVIGIAAWVILAGALIYL